MAATSTPCIFFQQGRCRNGDSCRFSHASASTSTSTTPKIRPDPRSQVLCKFYLEGICKQGTNCPYRHEQPGSSSSAQVSPRHAHDRFIRVFRGALVRYGDGACVTSLVLPSEYSSVRLDGLAEGTTTADVIRILEDLGHEVEIDGLRIVAMSQSSLCSAYISTPDLEFSKTLSDSLIDATYWNLKAVPVPPRLPSWASTRRASCNKLSLRWKNAGSECHVYFMTYSTALRVSGKFNSGKYRVLNTRIESSEPMLEPVSGLWSTIILSGLPDLCSAGMVEDAIEADYDAPMYVAAVQQRRALKKSTVTLIEKLLTDVGPIDTISEPHGNGRGYWTALARFKQESDAQKAAHIIADGSFESPHDVNLTARLVYNSTFKISKEVYHNIQQRLEDRIESLGARRMSVICRDTGIILSIDNWSSEEVAKCANAIEEIVAGDLIEGKDGRPFWVPQLATNGSASKLLKDIQQRHGVLLLPIRSKREVRSFGPVSKKKAVQKDVVQSLTEDVERRHTIDLDDIGFSWLCTTGLDLFKTVLGDNIVSLNVTSNPKKLIITGSDEEYCEILALLEINNISFASKEARSEESCSICFTPADEPVLLGCGHTYCNDCFRGLCRNGTTQTDMKVTCTEDKCNNAIPLTEIQAHADPSTFEQLLESSFSTYIARRPDQFHYCPTPDCGYIYRPASASASSLSHMCPKCLKRICRSCHVNHDGQRCDEHRAFQTFEAYKRENRSNVKDCPKCHTTVEKIDGCNHMQCGGCNIHLCWVCLKMFEQSPACYAHMSKVHGGIGIDEDEEEEEEEEDDDE
ncbi:hypothetical protein GGR51DRAFT_505481 [Nemania sp. FL0031]|nr:hypothetical protein GGR51DRAFT_505481 [Nemania sp. FL0031]